MDRTPEKKSRNASRKGGLPRRGRGLSRRLAVEALEPRLLLSISNLALATLAPVEGQTFLAFDGSPGSLLATFSDAAGLGPNDFAATLQWGDGRFDIDLDHGGNIFIMEDAAVPTQYDVYDLVGHIYAEEGTPGNLALSVTETTTTPKSAATVSQPITVADAPLSASAVSTIHPIEGVSFTGTLATFADTDPGGRLGEYSATIDWGDGTTSAGIVTQPAGPGHSFAVTGSHAYAESGSGSSGKNPSFPVTVTLVDTDGLSPPGGTRATATVQDTAVLGDASLTAIPLIVPFTASEGVNAAGVVATFSDANPGSTTADFSGTIQWGDGTTSAFDSSMIRPASQSASSASFNVFGAHVYAAAGALPLSVTINDAEGSSVVANSTATVADAPLSAPTFAISATQSLAFTGTVATFSDANPAGQVGDYSGTIHWGDGTTSALTSADFSLVSRTPSQARFAISATHTYTRDGIFSSANGDPVQVTVNDQGGASLSITGTATVADAPITLATSTVSPAPVEGASFTATVATFTTPNALAVPAGFAAMISWGDGTPPTAGVILQPGGAGTPFEVVGTHIDGEETKPGSPESAVVTVIDIGGSPQVPPSTGTVVTAIAAVDAPLSGSVAAITGSSGLPLSGIVATFQDGNPLAPLSDYPAGSVSIDWGDGTTSAGSVTQPGGVGTPFEVSGAHTYIAPGVYNVRVTVEDAGGAQVVLEDSAQIAVSPLLATPIDASGVEGASLSSIVASFVNANPFFAPGDPAGSAYSATIDWGDGTTSSGTIQPDPKNLGRYEVVGQHLYTEDGVYTDRIAITDTQGARPTGPVVGTVTVQDAPLSGTSVTFSPTEGLAFTGTVATFTDANPGAQAGDYAVSIDWGDGTPGHPDLSPGTVSQPGGPGTPFAVSGTHTYAQEGTYLPVSVTITDGGSSAGTVTAIPRSVAVVASRAVVQDAPLTVVTNPYPVVSVEGLPFADTFPRQYPGAGVVVATFTDADPLPYASGNLSGYNATILWAPGAATAGTIVADPTIPGRFDVLGQYTYSAPGREPIQVFLGDIGGSTALASNTATVNDAPLSSSPAGSAASPLLSVEGSTFTGIVARFQDASPMGTIGDYSTAIDWGDGTTSTGKVVSDPSLGGFAVVGSHAYAEDGNFTIAATILATDVPAPLSPASTSTSTPVRVLDAAMTASPAVPPAWTEGIAPASPVVLATFTDADPNAVPGDYSTTIDWGDGTTSAGTVVAASTPGEFEVLGSHTYAEDGTPTASVQIVDTDAEQSAPRPSTIPASEAAVSVPLSVIDATLTAWRPSAPTPEVAGQAFTDLQVAMFSDADPGAVAGDYTVTIDWGDGTTPTPGRVVPAGAGNTFEVLGSHTYAEGSPVGSPYRVTVQIADTDGELASPPPVGRSSAAVVDPIAVSGPTIQLKAATVVGGVEGIAGPIVLATLTAADPKAAAGDYSGTIHWGDGTISPLTVANFVPAASTPGSFLVVGTHGYAQAGTYSAVVQVSEAAGNEPASSSSATLTATIPVAASRLAASGVAEAAYVGFSEIGPVATFSVDGAPTLASEYSAEIQWGDGTSSMGTVTENPATGTFSVVGTHPYSQAGTYADQVIIQAPGGLTTTVRDLIIVITPPPAPEPTGQISPASDPPAGGASGSGGRSIPAGLVVQGLGLSSARSHVFGGVVATFTDGIDPAASSTFVATIWWGDGRHSRGSLAGPFGSDGIFVVRGHHYYTHRHEFTVRITIETGDGARRALAESDLNWRPRHSPKVSGGVASLSGWKRDFFWRPASKTIR